jgi:hypothetical protein
MMNIRTALFSDFMVRILLAPVIILRNFIDQLGKEVYIYEPVIPQLERQ